jgi:LysR family hydrogen peroxide-inducible transcriptional activator
METQHVRYFLAICDELNFTRAAQKCGIKQPTLSQAIKRMEQAIGGDLFVRASPVRLTALGFQLRPICVQINELLEKACAMSISPQDSARFAGPMPVQEIKLSVASQVGPIPSIVEARNEPEAKTNELLEVVGFSIFCLAISLSGH